MKASSPTTQNSAGAIFPVSRQMPVCVAASVFTAFARKKSSVCWMLAAMMLAAASARGGMMTASSNAPAITADDIYSYGLFLGQSDKFWTGLGAVGQTFRTDSGAVYLQSISCQVSSEDPSYSATSNKTYLVRVGRVAYTNFTVVASETVTQDVAVAPGQWMTWNLATPVLLVGNSFYGVDIEMTYSADPWGTGIPYLQLTDNEYTEGMSCWSSGGSGISYGQGGTYNTDRRFHVALDAPSGPGFGFVAGSPADDATNVIVPSELVGTFNQTLSKGSGTITITNMTDGTSTNIPVSDARITVTANLLKIAAPGLIAWNKSYAVLIAVGALTNATFGSFAGITNNTTWNFATAAYDPLLNAVGALTNHIIGTAPLNAAQIAVHSQTLLNESLRFADSTNIIKALFNLVKTYDNKAGFGPLWVNVGDLDRDSQTNLDLTWTVFRAMQGIVDRIYVAKPLSDNPSVFNGFRFESARKFPAACVAPNPTNRYTVLVNASYPHTFGRETMNTGGRARRPTGAYAVTGTVVTVTVPPWLVNQGYKIRVGCHSWDNQNRPTLKRLDRITTLFDILSTNTLVANPLGGNIYIEVPYYATGGVIDVTFTGAARSPLCRLTSFHKTTAAEWTAERTKPGPWADFETDKYMMQVPRTWIYAFTDPFIVLTNWDKGVDAANDIMGFPRIPGKATLYQQLDIQMRAAVYAPGWPFADEECDPTVDRGGNYTGHFFMTGPQSETGYVWHELGHSFFFPKFGGENESTVNLLNLAVHNRAVGTILSNAFYKTCGGGGSFRTMDKTAVLWMTSFNFSPLEEVMEDWEKAYQPQGVAKFADIVRLYGWSGLDAYYYYYNSNDEYHISYPIDDDSLLLQLCKSVNKDVRPLLHFWGIFPQNPTNLAALVAAAGLTPPTEIRNLLYFYKGLVPPDNAAYQSFCLSWYGSVPSTNGYGVEREHARQWDNIPDAPSNQLARLPSEIFDETASAEVKARAQEIIDLYYVPCVVITNPPGNVTVPSTVSTQYFAGTKVAEIVGTMWWTNSAGGGGKWGAGNTGWSFRAALQLGTNVITVNGTNVMGMVFSDAAVIYRIRPPFVNITNANFAVASAVTRIGGTNAGDVVGRMTLRSTAGGATNYTASMPATTPWSAVVSNLVDGATNVVTMTATNVSGDSASDTIQVYRPFAPILDITNIAGTVCTTNTTQYIAGTNSPAIVGKMWWTNSLGGGGRWGAAPTGWCFTTSIQTNGGVNIITVYGTNASGELVSDTVSVVYGIPSPFFWTNTMGGAWSVAGNWLNGAVANGAFNTAFFTLDITGARTVDVDVARMIGNITFADTVSTNYDLIFSGSNTLTFVAASPVIDVSNRTLKIFCPVAGSDGLTKAGAGTLFLAASNSYSGGTVLNAGTLIYTNADNRLGPIGSRNITFNGTATLTGFNGSSLEQLSVSSGAVATISGYNITNATTTGSGTLIFGSSTTDRKTLTLVDASDFHGTLRINTGTAQGPGNIAMQFGGLGDASGAGNIQFAGGSGDSGQGAVIRLYSDAGPLTLNNRRIEFIAKPGDWSFKTAILENNNASAANKWVINTPLVNNQDREHNLQLGGSNTGDNEFAGAIGNSTRGTYNPSSGNGRLRLIKAGTGAWILSGSNTYGSGTSLSNGTLHAAAASALGTGSVSVSTGMLVIDAADAIDDTAALRLPSAATTNLTMNADDTIGTLYLGGVQQPSGVYTSSGLGSGWMAGNGVLTVQAGGIAAVALNITNVIGTVVLPSTTSNQYLAGTNNPSIVDVWWANSQGGGGSLAPGEWNFTAMVYSGTNVITVSGTNEAGAGAADTVTVIRAVAPFVNITNAHFTVGSSVATTMIGGTNNAAPVGGMQLVSVTGTGTNYTATIAAATQWTAAVSNLIAGATNVVTMTATNSAGEYASDTIQIYRMPGDSPDYVKAFEAGRGADYGQVQLSWSNGLITILCCTNRTYPTDPANWFVLASGVSTPWTHTAASNFPSVYYRIVSGSYTSQYDVGKFDVDIAPGSIAWMSFPFGVQLGCDVLSDWFGTQLESRPYTGYNFPSIQKQATPGGTIVNADYYFNDFGDGKTNWYGTSNVVANAGYVLFLPQNHPGVKVTGIGMVQTNNVTMQIPYATVPWVGLAYDVVMDMRQSGMTNLFPQPRLYSSFDYDYVDSQQTLGGSVWSAEYYIDDWGSRTTNFFPSVAGADKLEPGKGYLLFFSTGRAGTGAWNCARPY